MVDRRCRRDGDGDQVSNRASCEEGPFERGMGSELSLKADAKE